MEKAIAKFKVDKVESFRQQKGGPLMGNVTLSPVTATNEENKKFYSYTPSGSLTLTIVNEAVVEFFEPGEEYYLTFTKSAE